MATAGCAAGLRAVATLPGLRQTPFIGVDELK